MLRQFLAVKRLSPTVQHFFVNRDIDSVDMVTHLQQLDDCDQEHVAKEAAKKELKTADVRAVREFRRDHPDIPISDIVERVKATRNIRNYLLEFVVRGAKINHSDGEKRLFDFFETDEVVSFSIVGSIVNLTINNNGRARLRQAAKEKGLSITSTINRILTGEL